MSGPSKRLRSIRLVVGLGSLLALGLIATTLAARPGEPLDAWSATRTSLLEHHADVNIAGPLRVSSVNPRYFTDAGGRAIYLTGSHTWTNRQSWSGISDSDSSYTHYLGIVSDKGHNFIRLWVWEQAAWAPWTSEKLRFYPLPYVRSGPGVGRDGDPKFDLTRFNDRYFERVRSRVAAAREHGIYVSVMLFQGWSIESKPNQPGNPWSGHPFNRDNNINGIDGDANADGQGREVHTLQNREVVRLQEAYVRKMLETLNDLDNVLWEISNESDAASVAWQYHMIEYVKRLEAGMPKQHPVGMTSPFPHGENRALFRGPADWISPNGNPPDNYETDPPAADGRKVIIVDTDHLWGVGGDRGWVWKSFTRGLSPIFMDPFDEPQWASSKETFEPVRRAMGQTLALARSMDLARMVPRGELASSRYCLANVGSEYLVYLPFEPTRFESASGFVTSIPGYWRLRLASRNIRWQRKRSVRVDLTRATGTVLVEWLNPASGESVKAQAVQAGKVTPFTAPFRGDAVLYLRADTKGTLPFILYKG